MIKLKSFLSAYLISRPPWYIGSKFLRSKLARNKESDYGGISKHLFSFKNLLNDGAVIGREIINRQIVESWQKKYGLYSELFSPWEGNMSFPFYNEEIHEILADSEISYYINKYFQTVYGTRPVLQQIPTMVITYPSMNQADYEYGAHNFPAAWHTDFKSEFTVHIPITIIDDKTPHTKYLKGTPHTLQRPRNKIKATSGEQVLSCFAVPGDAIFLDVDGWHRAQLERGRFRVFVQLKFTRGNNMLVYREPGGKLKKSIEKIKEVSKEFDRIQNGLKQDFAYVQSLPDNLPNISIVKNNSQLYPIYLI